MQTTVRALIESISQTLESTGEVVEFGGKSPPRFALFHAANSICSQKVRAVLAHHALCYRSFSLNIFTGQTYLPDYVRLRMIGCAEAGLPLVAGHSGSTAAGSGGCDPAVAPTLVDLASHEVIVDSKRICLRLDALVPDTQRLRPLSLQQSIDAELEIVDELPNYQLLAGRPAGADRRPASCGPLMGSNSPTARSSDATTICRPTPLIRFWLKPTRRSAPRSAMSRGRCFPKRR